jgi:hypothetical protein
MSRKFALAMIAVAAVAALAAPIAAHEPDTHRSIGALVQQHLRAGGPFFTGEDRALIERACGYAPGEWDGFELNHSNDVLICTNGRRVDDPEVRAAIDRAAPRISRQVRAVMARDDVRAAINRVAARATERAMRALARRGH